MASRGISLFRDGETKIFNVPREAGNEQIVVPDRAGEVFQLKIVARDELMMPRHIFVHQRSQLNPYSQEQEDEFCFVITPYQATLFPVNNPDPTQFPQFFRKDTVMLTGPSQEIVFSCWNAISEDVCLLVEAYNRLDIIVELERVRVGEDLAEDEDEEASESASVSASAST